MLIQAALTNQNRYKLNFDHIDTATHKPRIPFEHIASEPCRKQLGPSNHHQPRSCLGIYLYYTILSYTMLYYTIRYYTIRYDTILSILYYLYYTIYLYYLSILSIYTILYYAMLYYTILYYLSIYLFLSKQKYTYS